MSDQSVVVEVPARADSGSVVRRRIRRAVAAARLRGGDGTRAAAGRDGVQHLVGPAWRRPRDAGGARHRAFLAQAPRHGRRRRLDRALLGRLLAQWRARGLVTTHAPRREAAARPIERAFATYLRAERGLTPSTSTALLRVVHHFLAERAGPDPGGVAAVQPSDITAFVLQHAHKWHRHWSM